MSALFTAMTEVIWLGMWIRFPPPGVLRTGPHSDVYARAHEVNGKQYTAVFPESSGVLSSIHDMMDQYNVTFGDVEGLVEHLHISGLPEPKEKCTVVGWEGRDCYHLMRPSLCGGDPVGLVVMIFPLDANIHGGSFDANAKQHMIDMIVKGERP